VARCKTCDVEVPSTAEVVIEFEVDMNNTVMEGPLGEYTGYYTPASLKPVAKITAITHRKQPIFQGLLTGKPVTENHILKQIPFEASFLRALKAQFPTVVDVSVRASAGVSFFVVISMKPRLGRAAPSDLNAMSATSTSRWRSSTRHHAQFAEVRWRWRPRTQEDVITSASADSPSIDDPKVAGRCVGSPSGVTPRGRSAKPPQVATSGLGGLRGSELMRGSHALRSCATLTAHPSPRRVAAARPARRSAQQQGNSGQCGFWSGREIAEVLTGRPRGSGSSPQASTRLPQPLPAPGQASLRGLADTAGVDRLGEGGILLGGPRRGHMHIVPLLCSEFHSRRLPFIDRVGSRNTGRAARRRFCRDLASGMGTISDPGTKGERTYPQLPRPVR
jgi:hypothetical protein